jgi:hypothetical protein
MYVSERSLDRSLPRVSGVVRDRGQKETRSRPVVFAHSADAASKAANDGRSTFCTTLATTFEFEFRSSKWDRKVAKARPNFFWVSDRSHNFRRLVPMRRSNMSVRQPISEKNNALGCKDDDWFLSFEDNMAPYCRIRMRKKNANSVTRKFRCQAWILILVAGYFAAKKMENGAAAILDHPNRSRDGLAIVMAR